jgi:hypothetical protein
VSWTVEITPRFAKDFDARPGRARRAVDVEFDQSLHDPFMHTFVPGLRAVDSLAPTAPPALLPVANYPLSAARDRTAIGQTHTCDAGVNSC